MRFSTLALLWLTLSLFAGCTLTGEGFVFKDPKVPVQAVRSVRRVAIVPNRLPLLVANFEEWRKRNWEIVKKEFEKRAFKVVDYETSVQRFENVGLPVEDSPAAHDKYAQLCVELNADAIVIPYYATTADTSGAIFITHTYNSLATFQIYLRAANQFFTRVDAVGTSNYHTGFVTFGSLLAGILSISTIIAAETVKGGIDQKVTLGLPITGLGLTVLGAIIDIGSAVKSKDSHWTEAFQEAIPKALEPVFQLISASSKVPVVGTAPKLVEGENEVSKASCQGREADCEKACKAQQKEPCVTLAALLWSRQDRERAIALYSRACDLGATPGCMILANLYLNGIGTNKDPSKAKEYYETACEENGDGFACFRLAELYEQGAAKAKDVTKALAYFRTACKLHYQQACEAVERLAPTRPWFR